MKCRKCESTSIRTVYDKVLDLLRRHCDNCGYSWHDQPADRELTTKAFLEFTRPACGNDTTKVTS